MTDTQAERGEVVTVVGEETPVATSDLATRTELPPEPDPEDPDNWPEGSYIEDDGERFRVAEEVGFWPLAEYAKIASQGTDSETLEGYVAIFDLCRDLLDPRDFRRFGEHVSMRKYKGEKVLALVNAAMGVMSGTPSASPSDSPGGAANTSPSSNGTSTRRASSPSTGPRLLEDVPEEEREAYMASLSPVDRRRAMGIVPLDDDLT